MDTKEKRRDSGRNATKRPADDRRKTASAPKQDAPRRKPAAPEMPRVAQESRKKAAPKPARESREEVHRPTPSTTRHGKSSRKGWPFLKKGAVAKRPRPSAPAAAESKAPQRKRSVRPPRRNMPAVIYTKPTTFNLHRLLIRLLSVTAVVLALTMGLSVFFKIEVVTVSGAETYSEYRVREASGIQLGDGLLTFSRARAAARIRAELPYAERIRFGIKLPNTVIIDIEELDVVYAIQSTDGLWWFITSEGRVVEQTDKGTASTYTQILGVELQNPVKNEMATAAPDPENMGTISTESTDPTATEDPLVIPVTTTNAERLTAALRILKALEANDIVGEVATVNVKNLTDIMLDYGGRYDVELGATNDLEYKIDCMCDVIAQMSDYEMGTLDVSFNMWNDKVEFKPDDR